MSLELISFKICPFVQRAVITLLHKKVNYKLTYINLASPPEWFMQISPFAKVPVLRVDDEHVIFESAIIDEYLDEAYPGTLLPDDPLIRAIDRSWIEFATNLTLAFSGFIHSQDEESWQEKRQSVKKQFAWLENKLGSGPYFNGEEFSLVDIAYAPLFMRADLLNLAEVLYPASDYPKVTRWAEKLLALPELPGSVADDFEKVLKSHLKEKAAYAAGQMEL
jgi:glutathione S-transferase